MSQAVRSVKRRAGYLQLQVIALYGGMRKWMVLIVLVVVMPLVPFALAAAARILGEPNARPRPTPVRQRASGYSEYAWPTAKLEGRRPLVSTVLRRLDVETTRTLAASWRPVPQGLWGGGPASARKPSKKSGSAKTGKGASGGIRAPSPATEPRRGKRRGASAEAGRPQEAAEPRRRSRARRFGDNPGPEDVADAYALLAQLRSLADTYRTSDW